MTDPIKLPDGRELWMMRRHGHEARPATLHDLRAAGWVPASDVDTAYVTWRDLETERREEIAAKDRRIAELMEFVRLVARLGAYGGCSRYIRGEADRVLSGERVDVACEESEMASLLATGDAWAAMRDALGLLPDAATPDTMVEMVRTLRRGAVDALQSPPATTAVPLPAAIGAVAAAVHRVMGAQEVRPLVPPAEPVKEADKLYATRYLMLRAEFCNGQDYAAEDPVRAAYERTTKSRDSLLVENDRIRSRLTTAEQNGEAVAEQYERLEAKLLEVGAERDAAIARAERAESRVRELFDEVSARSTGDLFGGMTDGLRAVSKHVDRAEPNRTAEMLAKLEVIREGLKYCFHTPAGAALEMLDVVRELVERAGAK